MEITKLSSKGQIVLPEKLRRGIEVGTPFVVTKKNNLIILKEVEGLSLAEEKEMKELDKIWKKIDGGKCKTFEIEEFFDEMKKW